MNFFGTNIPARFLCVMLGVSIFIAVLLMWVCAAAVSEELDSSDWRRLCIVSFWFLVVGGLITTFFASMIDINDRATDLEKRIKHLESDKFISEKEGVTGDQADQENREILKDW